MLGKWITAVLLVACVAATACKVETSKGPGGKEDVRVETPVGDIKVKTDESKVLANIGLPAYPGATLIKDGKDRGAADVDMSVGTHHLRVKAISYHTADSPEKVLDFYRKGLSKYGDVIQCNGKLTVGDPAKTSEGLTCDTDHGPHVKVDASDHSEIELKTGSKFHQRVVGVEKQSDGTKIGLVLLDLPGGGDQRESQ